MTTRARLVRLGLAAAGALTLSPLTRALPARAEVTLHKKVDDSFSEDNEECGMPPHNQHVRPPSKGAL